MDKIYIFTDGACSGNPGPGGWGSVIKYDDHEEEISGGESDTTNNRMEMKAVIEALKIVQGKSKITITTDSTYVHKGITQWIKKWVRNNWKTADKKPVKNQDLWKELLELTKDKEIEWQWVRGHTGHPENERCDELARCEIGKII
ncbi:ribonuclease HI [Spirochaetota bacterium]